MSRREREQSWRALSERSSPDGSDRSSHLGFFSLARSRSPVFPSSFAHLLSPSAYCILTSSRCELCFSSVAFCSPLCLALSFRRTRGLLFRGDFILSPSFPFVTFHTFFPPTSARSFVRLSKRSHSLPLPFVAQENQAEWTSGARSSRNEILQRTCKRERDENSAAFSKLDPSSFFVQAESSTPVLYKPGSRSEPPQCDRDS